MSRRVLHILPHPGGGAETHIDLLERLPGYAHARASLSTGRTPAQGAASIPRNWPRILRAARGADLVNVHGDLPAMLSIPMLRAGPSLWTTHGLHFSRRSHGLRGAAVRRALAAACAAADVTVCTSRAERAELAPLRAGRLEVVRNAIAPPAPVDRAAVRAELGLCGDTVAILYLGQLEARKDPLLAVRAARAIPNATMLVAGDGPQRDELAAAGARLLGFRRDPERLLAAADILVMPSRHEGLSFAVLEALASGAACVVSDGPGNPEAVGDAGIVFPAGDEAALHAALARLAADPAQRERRAAAGRARAAAEFSVGRFLERMGALYADALAATGASAGAAPSA
ncbi:MAG: glycosyltransferase family 4 protein [Solirubrobacteraceae bacterium]